MKKNSARDMFLGLVMLLVGVVWIIPFYYPLALSVTPQKEVFSNELPSRLDFGNYAVAWEKGDMDRALFNTAVITVATVFLLIFLGSLCAYTIARKTGKRWELVYLLFVVGIILPYKLGLLPAYVIMNKWELTGTFIGIIIIQLGIQMPMTVFLYTGFLRVMPRTFEEAAQIDGATPFTAFRRVVFPLLGPVTAAVTIQTGIAVWNEFYMSLIFLSGSNRTPLSVALYSYVGENATQWNLVFASVVISLLPAMIVYLFAQKHMIKGLAGGIKG
jgi:raffinose/stachyose/melibiose transport system permease protein